MFGSRYLVAPVLEFGARNRSVYFPGGAGTSWRQIFSGALHTGGGIEVVAAPLDEIPVFTQV